MLEELSERESRKNHIAQLNRRHTDVLRQMAIVHTAYRSIRDEYLGYIEDAADLTHVLHALASALYQIEIDRDDEESCLRRLEM